MSMFDTFRIANTSLGMHQTWIDTVAHNIANVNTARRTTEDAFQAESLFVRAEPNGGGVRVEGLEYSDPQGRMVLDPQNELADENGYVRLPDMDLGDQMSQLIMAQRGYQASVQVTKTAQDTYTSALQIGA